MSPGSAPRTKTGPVQMCTPKPSPDPRPSSLPSTGPGAAAIDAFLLLGPQEHAFGAGIALDHALGIVIGMMRQRLDGDVVAGIDLELRLEQLAEIAPVHGVRRRRQIVVGRLARSWCALRGRGRDQRAAGRRPRGRRAAAGHEGALEEAAPFRVELVEQLLAMQLELRTIVIVACAHGNSSWVWRSWKTRSRQKSGRRGPLASAAIGMQLAGQPLRSRLDEHAAQFGQTCGRTAT